MFINSSFLNGECIITLLMKLDTYRIQLSFLNTWEMIERKLIYIKMLFPALLRYY